MKNATFLVILHGKIVYSYDIYIKHMYRYQKPTCIAVTTIQPCE